MEFGILSSRKPASGGLHPMKSENEMNNRVDAALQMA